MIVAIIDCGTNTFNLLIVDYQSNSNWKRLFQISIPVKLNATDNRKSIAPSRMARALDALFNFKNNIINFRVEKTFAFATEAFRSSINSGKLIHYAKEKIGISIEVISGDQEAQFIYQGVQISGLLSDEISLIMDIGGGSTEFILSTQNEVIWKKSYPIGVSLLYNKYQPKNPMTHEDIENITQHISKQCADLIEEIKKHKPKRFIGTAGSFNSLVRMLNVNENLFEKLQGNNEVPIEDFNRLYNELIQSSLEERLNIKGLRPYRAPFIPIAVIKVKFILDHSNINEIYQTPNALKEGVLLNLPLES